MVQIYVEGGGGAALDRRCREAFSALFERMGLKGRMPRVIAWGSRSDAYDRFRIAHASAQTDDLIVLLVDSEDPVDSPPWQHLKSCDNWERPVGATDDQVQMMATCMETWIVADREALRQVFGTALRETHLPAVTNLEARDRDQVQSDLARVTADCPRARRYDKGRRSFQALEKVNPEALAGLPHFQRLRDLLLARC